MEVPLPKTHSESYGLPEFSIEPNSEYQKALRKRDAWDPTKEGEIVVAGGRADRKIVVVSNTIIIKYCCSNNYSEYRALEDISDIDDSLVPRPIFRWQNGERYGMAMTKLPRKSLDDDAPDFEPHILRSIADRVCHITTMVRKLSKTSIQGPGSPMVRSRILGFHGLTFSGDNHGRSLIEHLIKIYGYDNDDLISKVRCEYSRYLDNLPNRKDVFVMTHCDLYPNNIIVDEKEGSIKVGIIDWEMASYMPLYWEHLCARTLITSRSWRDTIIGAIPRPCQCYN